MFVLIYCLNYQSLNIKIVFVHIIVYLQNNLEIFMILTNSVKIRNLNACKNLIFCFTQLLEKILRIFAFNPQSTN